jgi:hypothetical protein
MSERMMEMCRRTWWSAKAAAERDVADEGVGRDQSLNGDEDVQT